MSDEEIQRANELFMEVLRIGKTIQDFRDKLDGPPGSHGEVLCRFLGPARFIFNAIDIDDIKKIVTEQAAVEK